MEKMISTPSISDGQIERASIWASEFITTFDTELRNTGVPYSLIYENYSTMEKFPMGNKAFAVLLQCAGLERIKPKGVVSYILIGADNK